MSSIRLIILLTVNFLVPHFVSAQDTVVTAPPSESAKVSHIEKSFFQSLFENNPGVVTTLLTAVLIPVLILFLNNRHNREIKKLDHSHAIDMELQKREIEHNKQIEHTKRVYENNVHACLVKILFAVQRLHVDISRDCGPTDTDSAAEAFMKTLHEYQSEIANNQISLSPSNTNLVYAFYQTLSEMLIELKKLCAEAEPEIAQVCVYEHSTKLADHVISLQLKLLKERKELTREFSEIKLDNMRHCCGTSPSPKQLQRYRELKNKLAGGHMEIESAISTDATPE